MSGLIYSANFAGNFEEALRLAETASGVNDPFLSTHHAIALNKLGRYKESLVVVQKVLDAKLKDVGHIANLSAEKVFALIGIGDFSEAAKVARKVLELRFNNAWLRGDISASLSVVLNYMGEHGEARSIAAKAQNLGFLDEALRFRLRLEERIAANRLGIYKDISPSTIIGTHLNALFLIEELYTLNAQKKHPEALLLIEKLTGLTIFEQPNLKALLMIEKAKTLAPREAIVLLKGASKISNVDEEVSAQIAFEMARAYLILGQYSMIYEVTEKATKNERVKALLYLQRARALNLLNKPEKASEVCFKALGLKSVKGNRLVEEFMIEVVKAAVEMIRLSHFEKAFAMTSRACEIESLQNGPIKAALMIERATSLIALDKGPQAGEIVKEALTFPNLQKDLKAKLESIQASVNHAITSELQMEAMLKNIMKGLSYEKLKIEDLAVTYSCVGVVCGVSGKITMKPVKYEGGYYDFDNLVKAISQQHPIFQGKIIDLNRLRRIVVRQVAITDYSYEKLVTVGITVHGLDKTLPCEISKKPTSRPVLYQNRLFDYDNFMNSLQKSGTVLDFGVINLGELRRIVVKHTSIADWRYEDLKIKEVVAISSTCICRISGKPTAQPVMCEGLEYYFDFTNFVGLIKERGSIDKGIIVNLDQVYRVVFRDPPPSTK